MTYKSRITFAGQPVAGNSTFVWNVVAGPAPYVTTLTFHQSDADNVRRKLGEALPITIEDGRGRISTIEKVTALFETASDSPNRVTFVVADRRWKWPYKLVARDFNVPRKTGSRNRLNPVPLETSIVVDEYDYLPYSIRSDRTRWTAKQAFEEVLRAVEPDASPVFEGFPVRDGTESGAQTLQNVQLRDSGDAAVGRMLSYIPGADLYIGIDGEIHVFDATDYAGAREQLHHAPHTTWTGEYPREVNKHAVRPSAVHVYYAREVELPVTYRDDLGTTSSDPNRDLPYVDNVIQVTDPTLNVSEFDPVAGAAKTKDVLSGAWVKAEAWLDAMDRDRPANAIPWTFENIRQLWVTDTLESPLGAGPEEIDAEADVMSRVASLKAHLRQTFRINRRYMERIRNLRAVRSATLDPVTGARTPAIVWTQFTIIPSGKGNLVDRTSEGANVKGKWTFIPYDALKKHESDGSPLFDSAHSPATVEIVDEELGVFHVAWAYNAFGLDGSAIPCLTVYESSNLPAAPTADLSKQDEEPVASNAKVEGTNNGLFLARRKTLKGILTAIPAAPNDETQFERVTVYPADIAAAFASEWGITAGSGPEFHVFVAPTEMTARYAISDFDLALDTARRLFGFGPPAEPGEEWAGYILANDGGSSQHYPGGPRHLRAHAEATAAEILARFPDTVQGAAATIHVGRDLGFPPKLVGGLESVSLRVSGYPSARVDEVRNFNSTPRAASRFAMLPDQTRQLVLGTLPFRT